jgi:hypothetical protein
VALRGAHVCLAVPVRPFHRHYATDSQNTSLLKSTTGAQAERVGLQSRYGLPLCFQGGGCGIACYDGEPTFWRHTMQSCWFAKVVFASPAKLYALAGAGRILWKVLKAVGTVNSLHQGGGLLFPVRLGDIRDCLRDDTNPSSALLRLKNAMCISRNIQLTTISIIVKYSTSSCTSSLRKCTARVIFLPLSLRHKKNQQAAAFSHMPLHGGQSWRYLSGSIPWFERLCLPCNLSNVIFSCKRMDASDCMGVGRCSECG